MLSRNLDLAILQYLKEKKLVQTVKVLHDIDGESPIRLNDVFADYFQMKSVINLSKLSFSFNSSQSLLKKRLDKKNDVQVKKRANNTIRKLTKEKKIPESFLLLMDELCIDRKKARNFFKNQHEWSYIKSDRMIFCTRKGMF